MTDIARLGFTLAESSKEIDRNVGNPCRLADGHYIIERRRTVWSGD